MVAVPERLRRPRERRLPYGELATLRAPLRRAALARGVLAFALAATFLAALAIAFSRDARPSALLPAGTTGMIVLDLSASTGAKAEVGELFRRLASGNERTGLAVFSDGAYEVLPPGIPGRDFAPMVRFFTPGPGGETAGDPWSSGFTGGTNVVAGIETAVATFERDRVESGSILLISDLEFVPEQIARLPALLTELRRTRIEVRILPVDARAEQRRFFERVLGREAFVDLGEAEDVAAGQPQPGRRLARLAEEGTPWLFALLGGLLIALLALNERFCGRLVLPRPARREP
jgi:hypothetical protein